MAALPKRGRAAKNKELLKLQATSVASVMANFYLRALFVGDSKRRRNAIRRINQMLHIPVVSLLDTSQILMQHSHCSDVLFVPFLLCASCCRRNSCR